MKSPLRSSLLAVVLVTAAFSACRTARPAGDQVTPLSAGSADAAMQQLREKVAKFDGMRSLMRIRATTNGNTQSFRAQLAIEDARRMELIAYTPVGTTALTLRADGDDVTTDPQVSPEAFAFLRSAGLTPAETSMLLLGLPARGDVAYEVTPTGLASASIGDITVRYEPPVFPPQHVVVTRGDDRVEIDHLEVVH